MYRENERDFDDWRCRNNMCVFLQTCYTHTAEEAVKEWNRKFNAHELDVDKHDMLVSRTALQKGEGLVSLWKNLHDVTQPSNPDDGDEKN